MASATRNAITSATSSGVPNRRSAVHSISGRNCSSYFSMNLVPTTPRATQFDDGARPAAITCGITARIRYHVPDRSTSKARTFFTSHSATRVDRLLTTEFGVANSQRLQCPGQLVERRLLGNRQPGQTGRPDPSSQHLELRPARRDCVVPHVHVEEPNDPVVRLEYLTVIAGNVVIDERLAELRSDVRLGAQVTSGAYGQRRKGEHRTADVNVDAFVQHIE